MVISICIWDSQSESGHHSSRLNWNTRNCHQHKFLFIYARSRTRVLTTHTHTHQTIKLWHCSDKNKQTCACVFTSFVQTMIACKLRPRVRRSLSVCAFVRACPCHIIRLVYARQLCNFSHLPWEGCRGGVRVSVDIQVLWQAAQSFMRLGVRISNDTICGDNPSWRWNASRASFKLTFFFSFSLTHSCEIFFLSFNIKRRLNMDVV